MSPLVFLHAIAGTIAITTGFTAPFAKKGQRTHRVLGLAFFISILLLGVSGAIVAWLKDVPLSFLNGLLISYLVITSYNVLAQKPNTTNLVDKCMTLFVVILAGGFIYYAWQASMAPQAKLGGFGSPAFIAFGSVALFCSLADIRFISVRGLSGKQRVIRHLWRMFFPLLMATAAFFLGQAKLFPEMYRKIEWLLIPVVFVALNMLIWIVVVFWGKRYAVASKT